MMNSGLSIRQKASWARLAAWLMLCTLNATALGQVAGRWGDQGDGTYRNPVLAADYSDPDPLRVGEDYYMAVSTFESHPGATILHSRDLVNWTTIGAAYWDLALVDSAYTSARMGRFNGGVYAPTLSYHAGRFFLYANLYTDGFYMAYADNPAGPWTSRFLLDKNGRPLRVVHWSDPCPFWDDDGRAYLLASHPGREHWYSYLFQMSADGSTLLDADSAHMARLNVCYEYPDGGTVVLPYHSSEGNRLFKHGDYYYLQHIEFTNQGLGEGTYIFRSRNLYGTLPDGRPGRPGRPGEYEVYNVERVLSRDSLRIPGQGGYVDTPDGRWFYIGQFTRDYACGRPPHLLPVTWIDDWPVIGVDVEGLEGKMAWQLPKPLAGQPITLPQGSDEFTSTELHPQWLWSHVPDDNLWSLAERPGYMRLRATLTTEGRGFFGAGQTLCQRYVRSDSTTVGIKIDISGMAEGQVAGLAHFNGGKSYAFLGIVCNEDGHRLAYECNGERIMGIALPADSRDLYLRTAMNTTDIATFQYSIDGATFLSYGNAYPIQAGNFRGDMIGIFTYNDQGRGGYVDVDWYKLTINH